MTHADPPDAAAPAACLPLLTRHADPDAPATTTVALTFEQRQRARLRVNLADGRAAGIRLPRGGTLADGDRLADADGALVVAVRAAPETLSVAETDDPLLLARACYHLGNRHVALAIAPGRLAWPHDHVLDAMVAGLGLAVRVAQAPFNPEGGAYGHGDGHGHGHRRNHGLGLGHDHDHEHDNDNEHGG